MVSRPRTSNCCCGIALLACVVGLPARRVQAEEPATTLSPQESAKPWAVGVTAERQQAALTLLQDGNQLLKDSSFRAAADKYREALSVWDHPGIHYNLALALINFDQPLEAHAHLESALQYGPAPLEVDKFEHAKRYLALVERQLTAVDIRCDVPGAVVTIDGRTLFQAPGRHGGFERPGAHTVVASKAGFPPTVKTKVLMAGERSVFQLGVYSEGELIGYRRRWPLWRPIAVTAGGLALLGAGALLTYESKNLFQQYDQRIEELCRPDGCATDPAKQKKDRAELFRTAAMVSYVAGGAVVATGVVLLILDRAVPYQKTPEREEVAYMTPFLAPGALGLLAGGRF